MVIGDIDGSGLDEVIVDLCILSTGITYTFVISTLGEIFSSANKISPNVEMTKKV
jgi:hypothetical protein